MEKNRVWLLLILTALFFMVLVLGVEKDDVNREKHGITTARPRSDQNYDALSSAATRGSSYIEEARKCLEEGNIECASNNLAKTGDAIEVIKGYLRSRKMDKHARDAAKSRLPGSMELSSSIQTQQASPRGNLKVDRMSGEKRRDFQVAKHTLHRSETGIPGKELEKLSGTLPYREIGFLTAEAETDIEAAKEQLRRNNISRANAYLQLAGKNLNLISFASCNPIMKGRRSLWHAAWNYALGRYSEARRDLSEADRSLKEAMQSGDEKTGTEARRLEKHLGELETSLEADSKSVKSKLISVLELVEALAEREADRICARWHHFRQVTNARTDLVDARLHVSYAECYLLTLGDIERAKEDLEICDTYLKRAYWNATPELKVRIDRIRKKVRDIRTQCDDRSIKARGKFEDLETDIRDIIESLES